MTTQTRPVTPFLIATRRQYDATARVVAAAHRERVVRLLTAFGVPEREAVRRVFPAGQR